MTDDWQETQSKFRMMVLRMRAKQADPVQEIADAIPASRRTVYELLAGRIQQPSIAIRRGVERLVQPCTDSSSPAQSDANSAPGDSEA